MDFLDPKKQRRHAITLIAGYILVAIALTIGTIVLLYQAYGFGLGKNGKLIQNGLVFAATSPGGAQIRVNGVLNKAQTNARLSLVSGTYHISFNRTGYRQWQQDFKTLGGDVVRMDYAFLFPTKLTTTTVKAYDGNVALATQSPDRRWLLVQHPENETSIDVYDRKNPKQAATQLTLPTSVFTSGATSSWTLDEWSNDNQHVLLQHVHDGKTEFVMVDRTDASKSINLNTTLGVNPTMINLSDKRYDHYYVFDAAAQTLQTADLGAPIPAAYLSNVLSYKSYASNIMLYASSKTATDGKVGIVLRDGDKSFFLREVSGGTTYVLNLAKYSGDFYVALGASNENKVYVYKDPEAQLNSPLGLLVPISVLKTAGPNQLSFSANTQFIAAENGSRFSVYDIENDKNYTYDTHLPLDAPQPYATWMDGDRLTYVSGGKLVVFDFDDSNSQALMKASPAYLPFFSQNYKFVDTLAASTSGTGVTLSTTPLRTPADQ
jgi:hypothetical protein